MAKDTAQRIARDEMAMTTRRHIGAGALRSSPSAARCGLPGRDGRLSLSKKRVSFQEGATLRVFAGLRFPALPECNSETMKCADYTPRNCWMRKGKGPCGAGEEPFSGAADTAQDAAAS